MKNGANQDQLTNTTAHETNPVYDEQSNSLYYAKWTDDQLGQLVAMNLDGGSERIISNKPSQYGPLAISEDGKNKAFIRGAGGLIDGQRLEGQTQFELVAILDSREEEKLCDIRWISNRYAKRPPTLRWSRDGQQIYFSEYDGDVLKLKRIHIQNQQKETLYAFSNATRAVVSPTFEWIAFREYHRSFVTPFEFSGQELTVSAADRKGFTQRVDPEDGDFMEWSLDGNSLYWTRGIHYMEKSLEDILAGNEKKTTVDLSLDYEISKPSSSIVLRNARILTMNDKKRSIGKSHPSY